MIALSFLLLLASWLVSVHFPPWNSWHNETLAFVSAMLMSATVLRYQWSLGSFVLPRAVWPIGLLLLVTALQFLTDRIVFLGDAVVLAIYFLLAAQAMAVGYVAGSQVSEARTNQLVRLFAVVTIIGGVVSALVAFVQAMDVWGLGNWIVPLQSLRRPGGNLAQPNQLATLILFALVSAIYLFESLQISTLTLVAVATPLLWGLAITESRSGAISLGAITVWWFLKRKSIKSISSGWAVVLGFSFYAVCVWFWPILFNLAHEGTWGSAMAAHIDIQAGTRLVVWPQLCSASMMHPWIGWGLGQVSTAHNAVLELYVQAEGFTYSHNAILDLIIGVGMPLALLITLKGVHWLWKRAHGVNALLEWYALAFLVPFAVHCMLEFPFAYSYLLFPALLMVGVVEAKMAPLSTFRFPKALGVCVLVIAAVTVAWSAYEYVEIEEDFRIVRFESMRLGRTPQEYERPHINLLTQLAALLEAGRIEPRPGMSAIEIEVSRKVAMKYPWPATQNRYALSIALNGNPEEAVRQLKVMKTMHGEKNFEAIRANWQELSETKYPQLKVIALP